MSITNHTPPTPSDVAMKRIKAAANLNPNVSRNIHILYSFSHGGIKVIGKASPLQIPLWRRTISWESLESAKINPLEIARARLWFDLKQKVETITGEEEFRSYP